MRYNGKLFCTTIIKSPSNPTDPKSVYTTALQIMMEKFNCYISEHSEFDKGIIIADSTKQFDFNVAASHMSFIFGTATGSQLTNIYEAPLFADSRLTAGLQLVDNMSSIIYTNHYDYYCRSVDGAFNYAHVKNLWPKVKSLQFCSKQKYDGYLRYGFRTITHT